MLRSPPDSLPALVLYLLFLPTVGIFTYMITEEEAEDILGFLRHECMAIDFAEVNGDWYCEKCSKLFTEAYFTQGEGSDGRKKGP